MLQLKKIKKVYETAGFTQVALDGVSISFRENEFAAILGPSGSGKTTMLNIIGGLDKYDSGDLEIDNISTKKYKDRDWDTYRNNRIGFVFQSYNLIPHQTVLSNVELALTLSGVSASERKERAKQALKDVGLEEHIHKKPSQLSGGQMQRVAIARALINDPEILLADEPTGALDTKTSTQVMDMLTKIAKDRLVIMVTHNSELAEKYANRIVHLKDGRITSDSRPFDPEKEKEKPATIPRKSSMSFLTAISLSFSNLMTKKARTITTSFAGSIGIIGIACILALATGINAYIKNVEEETLSQYPLTIQSAGMDLTSLFQQHDKLNEKDETTGGVRERRVVQTVLSNRTKNDLFSLKKHFEKNKEKLDPYVNMIGYGYDTKPQIFLSDTSEEAQQVNPDSILSGMGIGSNAGMMGGMMGGSGGGMSVFSEMPSEISLFENQYDMVAGHWPEKYNEVIFVLQPGGGITDFSLYSLGLRNRNELKDMLQAFIDKEDIKIEKSEKDHTLSYEEVMSAGLKVINAADKYQYDKTYGVWVDKSDDKDYMKKLVNNGVDLNIVGIALPDEDATATSLSPGINYTSDLVHYLMEQAAETEVVKAQKANPEKNVLTGKLFSDENERTGFDLSKIMSFDKSKLAGLGSGFSMPNMDMGSIDFSNVQMPAFDMSALTTALAGQINIPDAELQAIMLDILNDFFIEEMGKGTNDPAVLMDNFNAYLERSDVQQKINNELALIIDPTVMQQQIGQVIQGYMMSAMQTAMKQITDAIQLQIGQAMKEMQSQMQGLGNFDLASAFQMNMNENNMLDLMKSVMNPSESTYEKNLNLLGYGELDTPDSISIYARNFEAKQEVINFLDEYNENMKQTGKEDKEIRYTDIVGVMMSSVTTIVDMVSVALIAFVSISLVVSSIMIGVITYISVLERKKEIGILRAIGASKKNIRSVFNAETLIVGFTSGAIGVGITLIICFIGSTIIENKFGIKQIAQLPFIAIFILIAISMFLTFIAGLYPASSASRKDPVEALRSE